MGGGGPPAEQALVVPVGREQNSTPVLILVPVEKQGVLHAVGQKTDISVGAQFNEVQVGLEGESGTGSTVYTETGTIPDPSVGFSGAESGVSAAGESTGYDLYYNTDADKYAAEE